MSSIDSAFSAVQSVPYLGSVVTAGLLVPLLILQQPSQSQIHRASVARAYLETKYKNLNQESQDREESLKRIQILNARMDQMGIAEAERDKYRQRVWQEVRTHVARGIWQSCWNVKFWKRPA